MNRRLTFVLAAFYLLQATWLLHAGVDYAFPRVRAVVVPDACCNSGCGCPEEARARNACCCVKDKAEAARPATPRPVSSIEELRCRGVEAAVAQAFTQPVVCGVATISLPVVAEADVDLPELRPSLLPAADVLLKVPIAQA